VIFLKVSCLAYCAVFGALIIFVASNSPNKRKDEKSHSRTSQEIQRAF